MSSSLKRRNPCPDWTILFEETSSLRLIIETVFAVVKRIVFKVQLKNGKYVLAVDGSDIGYICCVSSRLELDNVVVNKDACDVDEFSFCVEGKHLLTALSDTSLSGGSLRLEGHSHNATILLRVFDPDCPNHYETSQLSTIVNDDSSIEIKNMKFEAIVEIDVTRLKGMLKKARESDCEKIRIAFVCFRIDPTKMRSKVTFSVKGCNNIHEQAYVHDVHHDDDGSMIVRAAGDGLHDIDELDEHDDKEKTYEFNAMYPTSSIENFLKKLPTRMLKAQVGSNVPMMLEHELRGSGDGDSHIRLLVAATEEESDD